jgi:hypothetical protein
MATTATSVIGTWRFYIDWGDSGSPVSNSNTPFTFKSDGSWTYAFGGGRWFQVEGLMAWNFTNAVGLIYTANVTRNALDGIMGYAVTGPSSTGAFYAVRQQPAAAAAAEEAAVPGDHDLATGPLQN